jgi:uncharacterized membrane protein YbhN (UPF0104 family)
MGDLGVSSRFYMFLLYIFLFVPLFFVNLEIPPHSYILHTTYILLLLFLLLSVYSDPLRSGGLRHIIIIKKSSDGFLLKFCLLFVVLH